LNLDNRKDHIDDLIGKYLSGEAVPNESRFVENWIAESEHNRKYFNQLKTIFSRAATITETQHFDTDAAWNRVKTKLHRQNGAKTVELKPEKNYFGLYLKIAASIIIVLGIGFFTYRSFDSATTDTIEVIAEKKTQADTLPDGSGVFLNKETRLAYEFDKKKNTHTVKLKGEAYFNVHHKDEKEFIVLADDVFIRDIGTSFNVKAYPGSNTVEVVVEEGEVLFYTESDTGVILKANGKGVYDKVTKKFTVENPEPNVTAYKTKFFIFSDTDLSTVATTLNDVYTEKIRVSDSVKACRLTVTFNNESPDEIANVIAETLGLTIKRSGEEILLEGPGCGN
jgi:transmembrane sensor